LSNSASSLKRIKVPKISKYDSDASLENLRSEVRRKSSPDSQQDMASSINSGMMQAAPKVIEYTSHVYIASVLLKQGVEKADEKIKKYGLLDESLEFQYLKHS